MAEIRERPQHHQLQVHSQKYPCYDGGMKNSNKCPSATQFLTVVTLLPVGGSLLGLAGIILSGTLIRLAVAMPLFIIFSPVLVPAVILLSGAVAGILTSSALGLTGLSWLLNSICEATGWELMDYAKWRMEETARHACEVIREKTKQNDKAITSTGAGAGGGHGHRT